MIRGIKNGTGVLVGLLTLASCNYKSGQVDDAFIKGLREIQIDSTGFYISLPMDYILKENRGPDFSVFYFAPSDTTIHPVYSGGLYFGNYPAKFGADNDSCKAEIVNGEILSISRDWAVYNCNGVYTIQVVVESGSAENWNKRVHAFGRGTSREHLNKILEIYSTLKMK